MQFLIPIIIRELIVERTLCTAQVGLGSVQLTHQVGTVELSYHLSLFHYAVVVNIQMTNDTRHLGTNSYAGNRLNSSSSSDAGLDIGLLHLSSVEANLLLLLATSALN